ncbi:hypothetical protein ACJMK2_014976, partial [Sinanodonta woodiana]
MRVQVPCVRQSEDDPSGWYCITEMCQAAGASKNMTPTKNIHRRLSTIYASLENTEQEKEALYKHMGHSAEMNASVYVHQLFLKSQKLQTFLNLLDERVGKGQ